MLTKVSTVLAGDESLCLQCAELLLQRGHIVLGVVTGAASVREWAEEHGIPVARRGAGLAERVAAFGTFDYLLSIANLSILSDEVLALPTKGSINFHDGPLPRYAGLYCTSWALLNEEASHGVTWHLIEGGVDEGRVLAQHTFDIDDDETALTLNAKCYAAGIESFEELLSRIEAGTVDPVTQDLAQRSYFARYQRPAAMATIDPSASAKAVVALVRALDFGAYANPLSMAKLSAAQVGQVGLVGSASIVDSGAAHAPGTVVSVSEESMHLACADGVVELSGFRDAEGALATPSSLGFRSGERLPPLAAEVAERLSALHLDITRYERFWGTRLALPSLRLTNETPAGTTAPLEVIAEHAGAPVDELIAAVCVAVSRLTGMEHFSVGYVDKALSDLASELKGFIAPIVPLSADLRAELSVLPSTVFDGDARRLHDGHRLAA